MPKFEILRKDEENVEFLVNGNYVGHCNHDEDGWAGMESAEKLFKNIAEELGAELIQGELEDEEEDDD